MQTQTSNTWWLRITTFAIAALAAASAAFWVLKWNDTPLASPSATVIYSDKGAADPQAVARLLGGGGASTAVGSGTTPDNGASQFKLMGVVANSAQGGYALIAVDGQPARPFQVGSPVSKELVLQSVAPRTAVLAARLEAPATFTLALPELSKP